MTAAGYSGTPLPTKLGIKAGALVITIGAPAEFGDTLGPLPEDALVVAMSERGGQAREVPLLAAGDPLLLFVTEREVLADHLPRLRRAIDPDRAVWICWPKKSSGVPTTVNEDVVRELALPIGLVDVKVCAVDATWSGLRLVVRRELR
jgi:hypothetical protein